MLLSRSFTLRWACAAACGLAMFAPEVALTQTPPAGFTDTPVLTMLGAPTAFAFTPDGRLLVTTQTGTLRIYSGTTQVGTFTIPSSSICSNSERGLLGVAVDPQFATNRFIYLFYTRRVSACGSVAGSPAPADSPVNRVSRFVLPDTNVINAASETVLVDNMPSPAGNHNAGDVQFGKDGYLYISIGDGGCDYAGGGCAGSNDASRDEHVLTGKILRVDRDGNIPPTNPFQGAGTARCNVTGRTTPGNRCQETFARGLRNPFRTAFDPNAVGTRFFINDVGQNVWEEIDLGQAAADYGWNIREGHCANGSTTTCSPASPPAAGITDPLFDYRHGVQVPGTSSPNNCNSITGGAFVPNGVWPATYDNTYLFADYVCGQIFRLSPAGPGGTAADFDSSVGPATHLGFGPFGTTQALYYATFSNGGSIRRVSYATPGNNAPTAIAAASPRGGPLPLTVTFDATGSADPDMGDTLTYFWDFGDGSPQVMATSVTTMHTYPAGGVFTASLRARDNHFAFSNPATVTIYPGDQPPTPVIGTPAASATFTVGQNILLNGSATDAEDGTLPSSALSWTVLRHHADHIHPFLGPQTGNDIPLTTPPPEDLLATTNSYLEVRLTATDSLGLSTTVTRNFMPQLVDLTFTTMPAGLAVRLDGVPYATPRIVTSWPGYSLPINAPYQISGGSPYTFVNWSDAGAASHNVTTPVSAATYTATFAGVAASYYTVPPCRVVDTRVGGSPLMAGATRSIVLTGTCGVPTDAVSVSANVAIVSPPSTGFLAVYPTGQPYGGTSTLSFRPLLTRASNATVLLGDGGSAEFFLSAASGNADLVVDVSGYFR